MVLSQILCISIFQLCNKYRIIKKWLWDRLIFNFLYKWDIFSNYNNNNKNPESYYFFQKWLWAVRKTMSVAECERLLPMKACCENVKYSRQHRVLYSGPGNLFSSLHTFTPAFFQNCYSCYPKITFISSLPLLIISPVIP